MSADAVTWIWLVGGISLIYVELAWPHFYSAFFGLAAIIVAVLRWLHLLQSTTTSIAVWLIASSALLLTLRQLALRFLPSETSYGITDEDVDAAGQIVEVVATVSDLNSEGRIRFRGTSWPAISREGIIPAGQKAKILYRDNLVWKVERYDSNHQQELPPIVQKSSGS